MTQNTREAFQIWWKAEGYKLQWEAGREGIASSAWQAATEASKATSVAAGELPEPSGHIRLSNVTLEYTADQMRAYGQACAEAARQPAPVDDNDAFKEAYMIWSRKTDWVQEQISSFPPSALGKHRADVMREEIERLRAALAATAAPVLSDAKHNAALAIVEAVRRDADPAFAHLLQTFDAATRSQP